MEVAHYEEHKGMPGMPAHFAAMHAAYAHLGEAEMAALRQVQQSSQGQGEG
jgi:hypothetical protein